jgi:DNA polymerase III subunit delta'
MTTALGFGAIVGQAHPIRLLKTFIRNGTHPHALLFTGDDGIGKQLTAAAFAMACNCLTLAASLRQRPRPDVIDACGECIPCKKIAANQHPDIIRIAPASTLIRIDQIRELLQTLALKPHEARWRVVIISDAQAMNPEAGNALLKVLEEPPDRTLIVLTARQAADLLPTVVSRCRQIRFLPLQPVDIQRLLTVSGELSPQAAMAAAALCGGSLTRAETLIDSRWQRRRQWLIQVFVQMAADTTAGLRPWLAMAEMLAAKKDLVEESLEIITIWLRDLLVVKVDPRRVLSQDQLDQLTRSTEQFSPSRLIRQIDALEGARAALRSNTNVRLTLDAMVLQMAGIGDGQT